MGVCEGMRAHAAALQLPEYATTGMACRRVEDHIATRYTLIALGGNPRNR